MPSHRKPPRPQSPASSAHSNGSNSQASLDGGTSPILRSIIDGFEAGSQFSQLKASNGRWQGIVRQTRSLLEFMSSNNKDDAAMMFDKFDGRMGKQIYLPPQRAQGGVMIRCRLANDSSFANGQTGNTLINQVSNNITVQSSVKVQENLKSTCSAHSACRKDSFFMKKKTTGRQTTLNIRKSQRRSDSAPGRFQKKKIVEANRLRVTSPQFLFLRVVLDRF